jgi:hypothetical protein
MLSLNINSSPLLGLIRGESNNPRKRFFDAMYQGAEIKDVTYATGREDSATACPKHPYLSKRIL